ncbi:MAG TPA: protein-glutamate O-methyltransferase CheR, partial [Gemmatimonadaceae bacterium]|nr:protein-glutamate O-methyltransferase CheR [Gemmatimonadaceae bacterium]
VMSKLGMTNPVSLEIGVSRRGAVLEALLDDLTIGESYFFREPAQLRFMAEDLLPKWDAGWEAGRKLKVWSAGCAAGQEPYSIAIMLSENGWKRGSTILGTDISEGRLEVARQASFSKWSLRSLSPETIERWFKRKGSAYELLPTVRSEVDFRALNLLDPTPRPETEGQDAIFCRNVLIYFDLPAIVTIAERLLKSLSPDGWLFLGASDPHLAELIACEVVVLPGCTAYRRTTAEQSTYALRNAPLTLLLPDESVSASAAELDFGHDAPQEDWRPRAVESVERRAPRPELPQSAVEVDAPEQAIARVRELANEGRLKEAGEVCAAALEEFPDKAQLHLIAAILNGEAGRWSDSERAAKRALYLDRSLVLAHVALGDAIARLGNVAAARRSFENAASLLVSAGSAEMPDAGDMSTARLMDIVRAHLSMLNNEQASQALSPSRRAESR